ncbi:MAG TPA: (deoxy)nucleoside triphosphate pyrophosphohydrolase [Myxococcaceae bacterium]|nr:(deoxy)nucleoside triphosphate pyrophosphohydrolase [Myxococcaceae bacterium]
MSGDARQATRVVAALIAHPQDRERYLVQRRLPRGSRALLWEFPGGKVEQGESDAQALVRECREELGVELLVGRQLWRGAHQYQDLSVDLVLYEARIVAGAPQPLRATEVKYLGAIEMQRLPFCEADLPLLDAIASGQVAAGRT